MDDLISRQAAIDALIKTPGIGNRALDKIRQLPSGDAVPVVHGRWRPVQIGKWRGFECTSCKVNREVPCSNKGIPQWRYCPECGARMDGGEQDAG